MLEPSGQYWHFQGSAHNSAKNGTCIKSKDEVVAIPTEMMILATLMEHHIPWKDHAEVLIFKPSSLGSKIAYL